MSDFGDTYKKFLDNSPYDPGQSYAIDGVRFSTPPSFIMNPYDFIALMRVRFRPARRKRVTRKRFKKALAEAMRRYNGS